MIRQVLAMGAIGTTLASVSNPDLKRGNRVQGTLIQRRVQRLEEIDLTLRSAMQVRCNVPEKTILSVVVLTVESANMAVILASIVVRVGTWLEIAHRTEVWQGVILSLGLIHREQQ